MRRPAIVAIALLAAAGPAAALDRPVSGVKLMLRRTAISAKLALTSKDPAFLFPAAGSADDPSAGGLVVELFSPTEPLGAILTAPGGTGSPGWTFHDATDRQLSVQEPARARRAVPDSGHQPEADARH